MTEPRDRRTIPLAGVVILGLLLGACSPGPTAQPSGSPTGGPSDSPSPTTTVTPTESASPAPSSEETGPAVAACGAADLKASHGLVEGTAGSRETEVVLVTAVRCAVPAWPAFSLRDGGDGETLVLALAGGSGEIVVAPDGSYASSVGLSNWCGPEPGWPITLELHLDGELVTVTGGSFPEEGDLPPCSGGGLPTLTVTAWAPSS